MKLHLSWRLIALAVILLLFYLLIGKLLNNSLQHQNIRYTLDLADTDLQTIKAAYKPADQASFSNLQEVLKLLLLNNRDINSIAVVHKRNFVAHSDTTMIGQSITKEIFDRQRAINKNYDPQSEESDYAWQPSEDEADSYTLYRCIFEK